MSNPPEVFGLLSSGSFFVLSAGLLRELLVSRPGHVEGFSISMTLEPDVFATGVPIGAV